MEITFTTVVDRIILQSNMLLKQSNIISRHIIHDMVHQIEQKWQESTHEVSHDANIVAREGGFFL